MVIYKKYFWFVIVVFLALPLFTQTPLSLANSRSAHVHAGVRSMNNAMASAMQDMDRQMRMHEDMRDMVESRYE